MGSLGGLRSLKLIDRNKESKYIKNKLSLFNLNRHLLSLSLSNIIVPNLGEELPQLTHLKTLSLELLGGVYEED